MSFKNRVKRAISRGSSSPTESAFQSQEISRIQTPTSRGSLADHDKLTIDPRENLLALIESNTTAKRKSALARIRSVIKKEDPYKDWPEEIYKPHEIPRPKYKRPVDAEHKASLQAYSLRDAFAANMRRRSGMSQYSPMGTRLPSRRNSFSGRAKKSAFSSRNHSVVALAVAGDDDGNLFGGRFYRLHIMSGWLIVIVVLSRQTTENQSRFLSIPAGHHSNANIDDIPFPDLVPSSIDSDDTDSSVYTTQPVSQGDVSRAGDVLVSQFEKPFDEEELTRAFTRKLVTDEY